MNGTQYRRKIAKDAIDVPRKTVDDLAALYGISASSLIKYRLGQRFPSRENLENISDGLRMFARQLLLLKEQIDVILRENE